MGIPPRNPMGTRRRHHTRSARHQDRSGAPTGHRPRLTYHPPGRLCPSRTRCWSGGPWTVLRNVDQLRTRGQSVDAESVEEDRQRLPGGADEPHPIPKCSSRLQQRQMNCQIACRSPTGALERWRRLARQSPRLCKQGVTGSSPVGSTPSQTHIGLIPIGAQPACTAAEYSNGHA